MKDGGSVFPVMPPIEGIGAGYGYGYPERGLMLRDHIALEVLKELIKKIQHNYITCSRTFENDLAKQAYKFADAMHSHL